MRSYTEDFNPTPPVPTPIAEGASFGIRFLARFIDWIFGMIIALAGGIISAIILTVLSHFGKVRGDWATLVNSGGMLVNIIVGLIAAFFYHTLTESIGSTSLGKLICGLNVVHVAGQPCSLVGAFKRALSFPMDGLFFGLVAYQSMQKSALQQRYGDAWAKTVVVKRSVYVPVPKVPAWRVVLGLLVGAIAYLTFLVSMTVLPLLFS